MAALENLKSLKKDMERKKTDIDSFLFTYDKFEYIVLVRLYERDEPKPDFALLKLEFVKTWAGREHLRVPANASSLIVEAGMFRRYFGIPYEAKLGEAFRQFYAVLGEFVPTRVLPDKSDAERKEIRKQKENAKKSGLFSPGI